MKPINVIRKLNEEDTLSAKDYIESEYGLKLNTCAVRSKEQGIPSGLRDFLDVAKEIGLNVDDVSYGFPSLGDNYVGDSKTNIQVLSSAIDGEPIIGKIICPFNNYDENKVKAVAKEIIGTEDLGNDRYNIFLDNGDWSLQGIKGEEAAVYYYGTDKKGALNKLQSLNESNLKEESRYSSIEDDDPVLDKNIKVYDINAYVDKEINKDSEEKYQAFNYRNGAAIILKKDGSGCIVDYEAIGDGFNATTDTVYVDLCPVDGDDGNGHKTISIMATARVKCTIDELMTAPSKEMKVRDFFNKWDYNDRCARNFDGILPYLKDDLNESDESGFDTLEDYKDDKIRCFNYAWQEAHALKDKVYNSYWNRIQAKEKLEKAGLDVDGLKDSTEVIADHLDALGELLQKEDKGLKEDAYEDEWNKIYQKGIDAGIIEDKVLDRMAYVDEDESDAITPEEELKRFGEYIDSLIAKKKGSLKEAATGNEYHYIDGANEFADEGEIYNSMANSDVISILGELERYFNEGAEFVKNNNDIRHQFADGEEQVLIQCASKVKEISDLFNSQMDKY